MDLRLKPDPGWVTNARSLLGQNPSGSSSNAPSLCLERLFGAAHSQDRIDRVNEVESKLQDEKEFSAEQRTILLGIKENITVVEMAPGAGKTFIVDIVAMLFEQTGPNTALVITEQNVNMVSEIVDRLRITMPGTLVVRFGL